MHSTPHDLKFPLMDRVPKMALRNTWYNWDCVFKPWTLPSLDIREYYGAQIALYHSFLSHYATWSFFTGIAGKLYAWYMYTSLLVYAPYSSVCPRRASGRFSEPFTTLTKCNHRAIDDPGVDRGTELVRFPRDLHVRRVVVVGVHARRLEPKGGEVTGWV